MGIETLVNNDVQVLAVVCMQYGDTGKGKFSDYFASTWADVIARGTGGNNAGHTVVINGQQRIFHLIPAGIAYDREGKVNVLGNGMVIDPAALCAELDDLDKAGLSYQHLKVSKDAHVIFPFQVALDKAKDASQKGGGIGSTGRGIGPVYTDKVARRGVTVGDLYDKDVLVAKLRKLQAQYNAVGIDQVIDMVKKLEEDYASVSGVLAEELEQHSRINIDKVVAEVASRAARIAPFVCDTVSLMHDYRRRGMKILIEGAQGTLLSIEHGTYPHVTSSDCSINGTASGVGLSAGAVDLVLGIAKFPFMTRVGGGAFPTEFGGRISEAYCAEAGHEKAQELAKFGIPHEIVGGKIKYDAADPRIIELMNSNDSFLQGIGIRLAAGEYGATTGRPRRTGWTDAVSCAYSVGINAPVKLVLTKPDSVAGLTRFRIASAYENPSGRRVSFSRDEKSLRSVSPCYIEYPGYSDIRGETHYDKLPASLQQAIEDFEKLTGAPVAIVSTGPEPRETIVR